MKKSNFSFVTVTSGQISISIFPLAIYLAVVLLSLTWVGSAHSKSNVQNNISEPYTETEFLKQKQNLLDNYDKNKKQVEKEIEELKAEENKLRSELNELSNEEFSSGIISYILSLGGMASIIILWFFPLMVLNHFLFLIIKEKNLFNKYKKIFVIMLVIFEALFFLPLVVSAQTTDMTYSDTQNLDNDFLDPFEQKLMKANKLLTLEPVERFIYIMENSENKFIEVPIIEVKDSTFKPFSGKLRRDSAKYLFTLASFYQETSAEGKIQRTLKALNDVNLSSKDMKDEAIEAIYRKSMQVLIQYGQVLEASRSAERLIHILVSQSNVKKLIDLAKFLDSNQMGDSSRLALESAPLAATGIKQILDLAQYLIGTGPKGAAEAENLLSQAVERCKKAEDLKQIIAFSIKNNQSSKIIDIASTRLGNIKCKLDEYLSIAEYLIENGLRENGVKLLNEAKNKINKFTNLYKISETALRLQLFPLAVDVLEKAVIVSPSLRNEMIAVPDFIEPNKVPHKPLQISFLTYIGIVSQMAKQNDTAGAYYEFTPDEQIDKIISSHGYNINGNINNIFFLKQYWEKTKPAKLDLIKPIYAHLQKNILRDIAAANEQDLNGLKQQIENLEQRKIELKDRIKQIRKKLFKQRLSNFFNTLRAFAILTFLLIVLIGCIVKGIQAAKLVTRFKFYAGFSKTIESLGWSSILSVIGVLFGATIVLNAQLLQIFHNIQQNVECKTTK